MATESNIDLQNLQASLQACATPQERYNLILQTLQKAASAERGFVLSRSAPDAEPKVEATVGIQAENLMSIGQISHYIIERTFTEGEAILSNNASSDPRYSERNSVVLSGLRSVLSVPLKTGDTVTGLVYLDNRFIAGMFSQETLDMVKEIGQLVSQVIG